MENTILKAKCILAEMFNIDLVHFENNVTRKIKVVEARRFLTYFLVKELEVKYTEVKRYIPAIGNHATALHHCKLLERYLQVEAPTLRKYEEFKETLLNDECSYVEKEISVLKGQKTIITKQINNLKKLIK